MDVSIAYNWLRTVHVGSAFLGLAIFWLPLLAQKGGRIHVACGRIFVVCALVTLATAFVVAGWRFIDPIGTIPVEDHPSNEQAGEFARTIRVFSASLGAMAVYTLIPLVLAIRVVRTHHDPELLSGSGTRLLLRAQFGIGLTLIAYASALWVQDPRVTLCAVLLGVGAAGLGSAWWDLRFIAKPRTDPMFWWYKHMEFMLRIGIAYHTVFAVFVLTPWLVRRGWTSWALVPWVLPTAAGLPAIWLSVRRYRRKFGELAVPARADVGMPART